jgi:antimicrobial peptide system SdpA family protein
MSTIIKKYSYILTFSFCFSFCLFFVSGLFFYTMPDNPVKLNVNLDNNLFTFVPQGWAFFTRNPREAQIVIYKRNNMNQFEEINQRHSSFHNFFGLNRRASKIFSELQFIKSKINDTLYENSQWNYQENLRSKIPNRVINVRNQMINPILCGEYIVVYQKFVPWAWTKSLNKIQMPAKIIRLNIECDDRKN